MKFNPDAIKQLFKGLKTNADDVASAGFKDLGSKQFADLTNDTVYDDLAQFVHGKDYRYPPNPYNLDYARPHSNTALGKFYKKNNRLPQGLSLPDDYILTTFLDDVFDHRDIPF